MICLLGATRRFQLRLSPTANKKNPPVCGTFENVAGGLICMSSEANQKYQHCVPPCDVLKGDKEGTQHMLWVFITSKFYF